MADLELLGFIIGLVMITIAHAWLLFIAFNESIVCGLLYFFIPFYSIYYMYSRLHYIKLPVLILILGIGLVVYVEVFMHVKIEELVKKFSTC